MWFRGGFRGRYGTKPVESDTAHLLDYLPLWSKHTETRNCRHIFATTKEPSPRWSQQRVCRAKRTAEENWKNPDQIVPETHIPMNFSVAWVNQFSLLLSKPDLRFLWDFLCLFIYLFTSGRERGGGGTKREGENLKETLHQAWGPNRVLCQDP